MLISTHFDCELYIDPHTHAQKHAYTRSWNVPSIKIIKNDHNIIISEYYVKKGSLTLVILQTTQITRTCAN